jgi:hypothetical protein
MSRHRNVRSLNFEEGAFYTLYDNKGFEIRYGAINAADNDTVGCDLIVPYFSCPRVSYAVRLSLIASTLCHLFYM